VRNEVRPIRQRHLQKSYEIWLDRLDKGVGKRIRLYDDISESGALEEEDLVYIWPDSLVETEESDPPTDKFTIKLYAVPASHRDKEKNPQLYVEVPVIVRDTSGDDRRSGLRALRVKNLQLEEEILMQVVVAPLQLLASVEESADTFGVPTPITGLTFATAIIVAAFALFI
jgi:hypothetical protein